MSRLNILWRSLAVSISYHALMMLAEPSIELKTVLAGAAVLTVICYVAIGTMIERLKQEIWRQRYSEEARNEIDTEKP